MTSELWARGFDVCSTIEPISSRAGSGVHALSGVSKSLPQPVH